MDYKYSNMLTITYVTMLYGSGIPILYLIAASYFLVTYWVDKELVFYHYRKPEMYDENLAIKTLSWYKYAVVLHLIGGILMYSNSNILPVPKEALKTRFSKLTANYTSYYSFGSIESVPLSIYIGFIVGMILLYVVWRILIQTFMSILRRICKDRELFDES